MASSDLRTALMARPRDRDVLLSLLAALLAIGFAACTTEDVDWTPDAAGDATADAGGEGEGGSSSTDGSPPVCPTSPPPSLCTMTFPIATPLVADFSAPVGGTPPVFGVYGAPVWGGVYAYPGAAADPCTDAAPPPYPILSEMRDNQWRITGTLGTYSGFGLWWNCTVGVNIYPVCVIDVSTFSAIQFDIGGNPGPTGTLVFQVRTADDSPVATGPTSSSCGTCSGTCAFASTTIPVTSVRTSVTVPWANLTGGAPRAFDPHQITGMEWQFSFPGSGEFPIDLVVDDIKLLP